MEISLSKKIKGFNPTKIINSYGLNKDGKTRLFMSTNCFRRMHKYVPLETGTLATTTQIRPDSVTYTQVYARRQYHEHKGKGKRGRYWDKRMVAAEGQMLGREVLNYAKKLKG